MPTTGWFWDPDPDIKIVYQNEPHCFYGNARLCSNPIWFCRKTDKKYNWFPTFHINDRGELYYINIFSRTVYILSRVILHLNTLFSHWHIKWCKPTASFLQNVVTMCPPSPMFVIRLSLLTYYCCPQSQDNIVHLFQVFCRVKGVGAMVQLSVNIMATNGGGEWREGSQVKYQGIDVHSSNVRDFWENIS